MSGDVLDADSFNPIDCCTQAYGLNNCRGSRLEAERWFAEGCAIKTDGINHVTTPQKGRHGVQMFVLAKQHTNPGWPVELVSGPGEEIDVQRLHVHTFVRHGLRGIQQHQRALCMGRGDNVIDRQNSTQHVRDVGNRNHLGSLTQLGVKIVHVQRAIVEDLHSLDDRASFFGNQLPRDDIRVVLKLRNQNFIAGRQVLSSPGLRDEVDALSGIFGENHFALVCIHEGRDFGPHSFKSIRRLLR